ncbi:MAG: sugar transferase [Lachnospiraceae bacterium]
MRPWEELPDFMKCDEVKEYYDILAKKKWSLKLKRAFDVVAAIVVLAVCFIPMIIISILIAVESKGSVFYRQERVTAYGKKFMIHKFRTMVHNADQLGSMVTIHNDNRITSIGALLRKYRLDEMPQLFDVLAGNMSFVGTRPEVTKYVKQHTNEMKATLLLPAGITSEASIRYKNEDRLLKNADDVDWTYIHQMLPEKMKYNLEAIRKFSFRSEVVTMFRTLFAIMGKEYE